MRAPFPFVAVVLAVAALVAACGGGAADDPRCVSLCTIDEPSIEGAGDICSQASADACRQSCGAQIESEDSACAACLLEDASFSRDSVSGGNGECSTSAECGINDVLCNDSGPGGTCEFCSDDEAAELECYKKTHPRREVECDVDFRDPAKCSDLCGSSSK